MRYLRTNTATRITVGPFYDQLDGVTPEVALTVTSEKLTLVVDTAGVPTLVLDVAPTASGGANDMVHITGDDAGYYDLELAAADVNYLGRAMLALTNAAAHCPRSHEFMILPAVIYDAMVLGTDLFDVSVTQLLGTAWLTPGTAGTPDVNTKLLGGTSQTGRDLGASVLVGGYVAGQDNAIRRATAQTGANSGTNGCSITLDASASATDNIYFWNVISIVGGTGVGQSRRIIAYTGSSKVALVVPAWTTVPDSTSVFVISPGGLDTPMWAGLATGTNINQVTLDTHAPANAASSFGGCVITWLSGPNYGDSRIIKSYAVATRIATISGGSWINSPVSGDAFVIRSAHAALDLILQSTTYNSLATAATGMVPADVRDFGGSAGTFASGIPSVNATQIEGADATDTITAAVPTAVQNADALLARNQQGGANSAPTVSAALAGGLMLIDISAGTLTVKNGDGSTAFTRTLTRSALDAIINSV